MTGISLSIPFLSLTTTDAPIRLTAAIEPADATNKNVAWSSSHPEVATVSGGVITPISPGSTVITAAAEDGGFSDYCNVEVNLPMTGLSLTPSPLNMFVGSTYLLTPAVTPPDAAVFYISSNPAIAEVGETTGIVTAVAQGSATITAIATKEGYRDTTTSVTVNVIVSAIKGDVNFDSIINVQDILKTINIILAKYTPSSDERTVADVNSDGNLNIQDVVKLVNIILGKA